jgi:hypothetical protein
LVHDIFGVQENTIAADGETTAVEALTDYHASYLNENIPDHGFSYSESNG